MKCYFLVSCFMMIVVLASSSPAGGRRNGSSCRSSEECCSHYCRNGKCINYGNAADDKYQRDPCKPNRCPHPQSCYRQQVQCFRFPCPPIAYCK